MMEMDAECTVSVMENLLAHGKFNIPTRNAMENAVRLLRGTEAEAEFEGDGKSTWWFVCGECHTALDTKDRFCRECGRKIIWT